MSLHYWTSDFAGIEIPYSEPMPSEEKWREFLEKYKEPILKIINEEMYGEVYSDPINTIQEYEGDNSEIGVAAFLCDVINTVGPWSIDCAVDMNDGYEYLGLFASNAYPWSKPLTYDVGLTKETLEAHINSFIEPLYGHRFSFNDQITISYAS